MPVTFFHCIRLKMSLVYVGREPNTLKILSTQMKTVTQLPAITSAWSCSSLASWHLLTSVTELPSQRIYCTVIDIKHWSLSLFVCSLNKFIFVFYLSKMSCVNTFTTTDGGIIYFFYFKHRSGSVVSSLEMSKAIFIFVFHILGRIN